MLGTDAATEQQSGGSGEGDDGVARHGIYECIHQAFKHKTGMRNERGKLCKNYAKRHKHDNHACTHTHTHAHSYEGNRIPHARNSGDGLQVQHCISSLTNTHTQAHT